MMMAGLSGTRSRHSAINKKDRLGGGLFCQDWAVLDLNQRPPACRAGALAN